MEDTIPRCNCTASGRWFAKAKPPKMRKYDKYKITPGRIHEMRIVSSRICGVITHHVGFRDQICTETDTDPCWYPHTDTSSRYHGWLAVTFPPSNIIHLVALTDNAVYCDARFEMEDYSLRGMLLRLKRTHNYDWAPMEAQLVDVERCENLPLEPSLMLALTRMFEAPDDPNGKVMQKWRRLKQQEAARRGGSGIV